MFNTPRDIANVFGGLCRSDPKFYHEPLPLVQLYLHEVQRVYRDRLISDTVKYGLSNMDCPPTCWP